MSSATSVFETSSDFVPERTLSGHLTTFRTLLPLMRPFYNRIVITLLAGFLNDALAIGSAVLGAWLVGASATGYSVNDLLPWVVLLGVLVVARGVIAWIEMWFAHDVAYGILAELRGMIYSALERLAPGYLLERRTGDLAATAMADVEILEWFYAHTVTTFVIAATLPAIALGLLAWLDPLLPLVLLPSLVLAATVPFWLHKLAARQGRHLRRQVGELNADVIDNVQGLREIAIFGQERARAELITQRGHALTGTQLRHGARAGLERVAVDGLRAIGMVTTLATAAWLVTDGQLPRQWFPAVVLLAYWVFEPVNAMTNVARDFGILSAAADRVFAILHAPTLVEDKVAAPPTGPIEPRVTFSDVTFRYNPILPNALSNVSFEIAPGETVALVGHSGAGKSTCTHLMLRFWDVSSGAVQIGGHDVRTFPQTDLRDLIAIVPQDIYLFNTTIAENIRLGRPDATDADVEAAARAALAHEFIVALPDGYETAAGDRGVQMSGGQRQRLAIARALLRDAPILIMDEAVSNLDAENERLLQEAMRRVRAGRTSLLIAHRLSTIRSADRVVVLDGGMVAAIGRHDDLVLNNSAYNLLNASQQIAAL